MTITWYPGHMHKAGKELRKLASTTDAVVEVLDARIPAASSNPLLKEIFKGKPTLKLLNKCDLAETGATSTWQAYFNASDSTRSLTLSQDKQSISKAILAALAALTDNTRPATAKRRQAVIFGVPNVGKSTILNAIAGRKLARTGNEPAVTKGQQRIKLNEEWTLIDTPGMLWPKLEDQQGALWLAMIGSIRHTALDVEEIGWMAAETLAQVAPALLKARYGLDVLPEQTEQLVAAIAHATGSLTKGGLIDGDKVAQALLNDFRSGKLGALTLESIPP
ncbi:MAG: ribosome biogenesis GTPase YlqF [Pseudohongiellaceae bacterium]|jgi:ribosome biogenesis GTPase A